MYKKVIATGGIVSSLFLAGTTATFAQDTNSVPKKSAMHQGTHKMDFTALATKLGLDASAVQAALDAGKKWPDILKEQGINKDAIQKFAIRGHRHKNIQRALDIIAPKLGLNADDIRAEIEAGKTLHQVFEEQGITPPEHMGKKMGHIEGKRGFMKTQR